jgi:hypothetical protein
MDVDMEGEGKPASMRDAIRQILDNYDEELLRSMDMPMESLASTVYAGLTAIPFEYTPEEIMRGVASLPKQNAMTKAIIRLASKDAKPQNDFIDGMGKPVVMDRKDYVAEHKRLIALLEGIVGKASKEVKKQKAEPALKGGKKSAFKGIHWGAFTKQWKAYRKQKFATLREFANYVDEHPKEFRPLTLKRARFYKHLIIGRGSTEDEFEQ